MERRDDQCAALERTVSAARDTLTHIATAWGILSAEMRTLRRHLQTLETEIRAIAASHYTEEDSPKGENVPGVRHRSADGVGELENDAGAESGVSQARHHGDS